MVVSEVSELKANPKRPAKGVVVEARRDKSRGTIATVLVQTGTLKIADNFVVGELRGRVRAMFDDKGESIKEAGPSMPAEVLGLSGLPEAGDTFEVVADEKTARRIVDERTRKNQIAKASGLTMEDVHTRLATGEVKALNLIVKTDVQGSVEAVKSTLMSLNTTEYRVNLVHAACGTITESDVLLAVASQAIIVGFNSRPEPGAKKLSGVEGVEIRHYEVIYDLVEDIEDALQGLLEPVYRDIVEGQATVRAVFSVGRRIKVAGIYVNDGHIARDSMIHVLRGGQKVHSGSISSLKHFKDDVREVATGLEGGIVLEGFSDFEEGDIIEAHRSERVR